MYRLMSQNKEYKYIKIMFEYEIILYLKSKGLQTDSYFNQKLSMFRQS